MKRFFQIALLTALSVMGGYAQTTHEQNAKKATELLPSIITMDTHNHIDVPMEKSQLPAPRVDLRSAMLRADMNGVCMTFAVDYVQLKYEGHAYERFLNALTAQDSVLAWSGLSRALNMNDIEQARTKGEPFVIQCVEGGHFLEGDVSRMQVAYDRGLRVFCLLHDNDATPPLGDVYTNEPRYGGLTQLGADAIRECERLGILVDLAHCDSATIAGALAVATKPIIITHTGLNTRLGNNEFMGRMMYKRLISPAQARMVAAKGGVIGIWPHLADSPKDYAQNIRAMADIVGVDHVCIGTDEKLTPEYSEFTPEDMERHRQEHEAHEGDSPKMNPDGDKGKKGKPQGGGFKKKDPNAPNFVWGDEPDSFYHSVVTALLDEGFSEEDISKLCSGNFLRVFGEATKK